MMTRLALAALLFAVAALFLPLTAQTPDDAPIRELVARLDRGETEAVKTALPEYVARYQNHPGVLYVQGRVATDGIEAAKSYQSVIDNYPQSEWADDALYSLYQYYYAMGLYKTAELKMQQIRKEYPKSEHLTGTKASATDSGVAGAGAAATSTSTPPGNPAAETPAPPASIPPPGNSAGAAAAGQGASPYALQVGAFSTSENAMKQKSWFEERGYAAEITNRVRGGKSLFLVWVGSFASADEARKTLREIQSRYDITSIVVER